MAGRSVLTVFCALAALAGLGYANWYAAETGIDVSAIAPPAQSAGASPNPGQGIGENEVMINDLKETLARPLFNSTRRPDPPVAAATPPAPETPVAAAPAALPAVSEHLQLLGMMRQGQGKARALIRVENAATAAWFDVGAEIGGWRLREIGGDHVVVESGGQRSKLALHPGTGAGPAAH